MRGGRKKRRFTEDSRGLSAVVTTLLIILLAIVAIGIVWAVVSNILDEGTEGITLDRFVTDISISSAYIEGSNVKVIVRRSPGGGDVSGIEFIFSDGFDSSNVRKTVSIEESERKSFIFTSLEVGGIDSVEEVSVAPVFSETNQLGDITDTATISSTPPAGVEGGEGEGDPGTGTCGDGVVQSPNGELPSINELCDGSNLNSQTCGTLGLGTGGLSCDSGCQFDTSSCSEGTPSSCNGTWDPGLEDVGVECDGGNKCEASCVCSTGFTADGVGGCNLNAAVSNGMINSVWNSVFLDSQSFPKSQVAMSSYIAYSINFSNSPEISCFGINFADYVSETDISYVRLDDSLGFPNVSPGENYSVWEAPLCGA